MSITIEQLAQVDENFRFRVRLTQPESPGVLAGFEVGLKIPSGTGEHARRQLVLDEAVRVAKQFIERAQAEGRV